MSDNQTQSNHRRAKRRSTVLLLLSLAVVASASAVIGWELRGVLSGVEAPPAMPVLGKAPSYEHLSDQTGATVSSDRFHGKVQVVTFLFPYCTTYCPLIAAHLTGFENLLRRAGLQDQVNLVAFDVDPAHTGKPEMRSFLKEYGWDPDDRHWEYLTGKPRTIRRIVTGGFHVAYRRVSEGADSSEGGPAQTPQPEVENELARKAHVDYDISHNDGLVLVDPQGRVRKVFDQADMVSNRELLSDVRRLLGKS